MDLWVVNDTIRRSGMRMFRALPRSEAPGSGGRIRGRFGLLGECQPKEAVGSGSGTGWEGVAGWDQAAVIDELFLGIIVCLLLKHGLRIRSLLVLREPTMGGYELRDGVRDHVEHRRRERQHQRPVE